MTTSHYKRIGNETYADARRRYERAWYQRTWGVRLSTYKDMKERGIKSEELAKNTILPKLGFTNIIHLSAINRYSPSDFYAEKNNKKYFIEVTTNISKCVPLASLLAELLDLNFYVLGIKPDFSAFLLKEVPLGKKSVYINHRNLIKMEVLQK